MGQGGCRPGNTLVRIWIVITAPVPRFRLHLLLSVFILLFIVAVHLSVLIETPEVPSAPFDYNPAYSMPTGEVVERFAYPRGAWLPARRIVGPTRVSRLGWELTVDNPQPTPTHVRLTIPIPPSDETQQVDEVRVTPAPRAFRRDAGRAAVDLGMLAPRQRVTVRVDFRVRHREEVRDFDVRRLPQVVEVPKSLLRFTEGTADFPAEDPQVCEWARVAVHPEPHYFYRALRLYDAVRVMKFEMAAGGRSVLAALDSNTVQCSDAAALLVAGARSVGIPARYVGGVFVREEARKAPIEPHAWVELYVPEHGWVTVDPTMGRFDDLTRVAHFGQRGAGYVKVWMDTPRAVVVEGDARVAMTFLCEDTQTVAAPSNQAAWLCGFPVRRAMGPAPETRRTAKTGSRAGLLMGAGIAELEHSLFSRAQYELESAVAEEEMGETHRNLAVFLIRTMQISRALQELERALKVDDRDYYAWRELINLYAALEIWDRVLEASQAGLARFPEHFDFLSAGGQACLRLRRWEQARGLLANAVGVRPEHGWAHVELGWALKELGRFEEARAAIRQGVSKGLNERERVFGTHLMDEMLSLERP
ncbi:MAG: hypothetical protein FJX76_20325 [Armatimonadetes bacterium]|nr:hypothetical protein [Armatimonadota bacterium]